MKARGRRDFWITIGGQRSPLEHRERSLATCIDVPVHRIDFEELLANPGHETDRLIGFLEIEPTEDERQPAIAEVIPSLSQHV